MSSMRFACRCFFSVLFFGVTLVLPGFGQTAAVLTSPTNGATVPGQQIQFAWAAVSGAVNYTLWIGTSPGQQDVLYYTTAQSSNPAGITSTMGALQPGATYYARLWTLTSAGYLYSDTVFQTAPIAYITAPANQASGVDPIIPTVFTWTPVPGAASYSLSVGTSSGASDVYQSGALTSTSVSVQLQKSTTYYATLVTNTGSSSYSSSISFATGTGIGHFATPLNGATNVDPFAPITWNGPSDALSYVLDISTQQGGADAYFSWGLPPTINSRLPWGLQPNTTYYARLYTQKPDGLHYEDIQFKTAGPDPLPDRATFYATIKNLTAQVRAMTNGTTNYPLPGTVLYQAVADRLGFNPANGADCASFSLALLHVFSQNRILARDRNINLNGADDHNIVEYWDPFNAKWAIADATFGLIYFDAASQIGWSADDVSQALHNNNLQAIPMKFVTPYYDYYMRNYYMDPITLYNNVVPMGGTDLDNAPNSPLPYLNQQEITSVSGQPGVYLAQFANPSDTFQVQNGGTTVTFSPYQTSTWSTAEFLYQGWQPGSVPQNMQFFTYKWLLPYSGLASLIYPNSSSGNLAPGQVTISWNSISDASAYRLQLGTSVGDSSLYDSGEIQATNTSVSLLPVTTYYARLWTQKPDGWFYADSTFQTTIAASVLTSPANGSTASTQVQFSWTLVPGALDYTLWIGTSPGTQNIFYYTTAQSGNPGGIFSTTATLAPKGTYYARLWTRTSAGYVYSDSVFQTAGTAYLTSPASGATVSPQVQLTWTPVPGATSYGVWIGSSPNTYDAFYYGTTGTSASATLQPGRTYYVTLWTNNSGSWSNTTSTLQTTATASLLSPANGSANLDAGAPVAFTWTPISNVTWYELYLGSSEGARDYYDSGDIASTNVSVTLKPNTTYYARLWTDVGGQWSYTDSTFSTGYSLAHLTYPLDGATNVSSFQPFTWSLPSGSTGYSLTVSPTGYGVADFFVGIKYMISSVSSSYVWGLLPNTKYYVRLCTYNAGPHGGGCVNSSFTTGTAPPLPPDRNAFYQTVQSLTAQVRQGMTQGLTNIPVSGSYLAQFIANHAGNPNQSIGAGWFAGALLDQFTMNRILARQRNTSLDGADGHVLAEYWDPFNQKWEVADPTFGVIYFDSNAQTGQAAEEIQNDLLSGNLSTITPLFVTSYGNQYLKSFYADPATYFANVMPFGLLNTQDELNYVPNSPLPFLVDVTSAASGAGVYVFYFSNPTDSVVIQNGGNVITVSPVNHQGWAASIYLGANWSITSPVPGGMRIYQFRRMMF